MNEDYSFGRMFIEAVIVSIAVVEVFVFLVIFGGQ
jgi:hypothetical protein